jgi:spore coat-associated protein N
MARFSVLVRHPRRTLGALAMLLLAVGVAVGSGANFTASAANPSNTFSAGSLSIGNTPSSAVLTASNMKPGDAATVGTVNIKNTGSVAGTFSLAEGTPSDSDSAHPLSGKLDLVVKDCGPVATADCSTGTTKYSGKLGSLTSTSLGSFASSAERKYEFSVSFPSGADDDDYQGDNTSVAFNWSATS